MTNEIEHRLNLLESKVDEINGSLLVVKEGIATLTERSLWTKKLLITVFSVLVGSALVYKGLDIVSAKPLVQEQEHKCPSSL